MDPTQPKTVLEVPQPKVLVAVKNLWSAYRKEANIELVLDVSPSMDDQDKLKNALDGLRVFLDQIRDVDQPGLHRLRRPGAGVGAARPGQRRRKRMIRDYLDNPDNLPRPDSTAAL